MTLIYYFSFGYFRVILLFDGYENYSEMFGHIDTVFCVERLTNTIGINAKSGYLFYLA